MVELALVHGDRQIVQVLLVGAPLEEGDSGSESTTGVRAGSSVDLQSCPPSSETIFEGVTRALHVWLLQYQLTSPVLQVRRHCLPFEVIPRHLMGNKGEENREYKKIRLAKD